MTDPFAEFEPEGLRFTVAGKPWRPHAKACLMLHNPAGYEYSQRPSAWPSIYTLLPALRQRPVKGSTPDPIGLGRHGCGDHLIVVGIACQHPPGVERRHLQGHRGR